MVIKNLWLSRKIFCIKKVKIEKSYNNINLNYFYLFNTIWSGNDYGPTKITLRYAVHDTVGHIEMHTCMCIDFNTLGNEEKIYSTIWYIYLYGSLQKILMCFLQFLLHHHGKWNETTEMIFHHIKLKLMITQKITNHISKSQSSIQCRYCYQVFRNFIIYIFILVHIIRLGYILKVGIKYTTRS